MAEVNQIVKAGESVDIGQAMQNLIQDNINRLSVCFLAKVQSVNGNKVDVVQVMQDTANKGLVIPSLLVGIPQSTDMKQNMKIQVGDYGLCLVCDSDISVYKQSGDSSQKATNRTHNLIDSIFLPLSLYNSSIESSGILASSDYSIEAKGDFSLIANLLTIKSQQTSLKTMLEELSDNISAIATTGGYTLTPDAVAKFTAWKNKLSQLFKE